MKDVRQELVEALRESLKNTPVTIEVTDNRPVLPVEKTPGVETLVFSRQMETMAFDFLVNTFTQEVLADLNQLNAAGLIVEKYAVFFYQVPVPNNLKTIRYAKVMKYSKNQEGQNNEPA